MLASLDEVSCDSKLAVSVSQIIVSDARMGWSGFPQGLSPVYPDDAVQDTCSSKLYGEQRKYLGLSTRFYCFLSDRHGSRRSTVNEA